MKQLIKVDFDATMKDKELNFFECQKVYFCIRDSKAGATAKWISDHHKKMDYDNILSSIKYLHHTGFIRKAVFEHEQEYIYKAYEINDQEHINMNGYQRSLLNKSDKFVKIIRKRIKFCVDNNFFTDDELDQLDKLFCYPDNQNKLPFELIRLSGFKSIDQINSITDGWISSKIKSMIYD